MKEYEPSSQVPTLISPEAWDSAATILGSFEAVMSELGVQPKESSNETRGIIAMVIQHAINRYVEREDGQQ